MAPDASLRAKVFVGGLKDTGTEKQLKQIFEKFGQVKSVWMAKNPPGFAFIDFFDEMDARDACEELDGSTLFGLRVSVEMAKGYGHSKTGNNSRGYMGGNSSGRRRSDYDDDRNSDRKHRDRSPIRSNRRSPDYNRGGNNTNYTRRINRDRDQSNR